MAKRIAFVLGTLAVLVSVAGFAFALLGGSDHRRSNAGGSGGSAPQNPLPPALELSGGFAWIDGDTATVFFSVTNTGGDDTLTHAESDVAEDAQFLGRSVCNNDTGSVERRDAISVAPTDWTIFKPGGCRLELKGLTRELEPGDGFELRLIFDRAGTLALSVPVKENPGQ